MIELKVCDFCHSCLEFEAEVKRSIIHADSFDGSCESIVTTRITCVHENRCQCMMNYLFDERAKGEQNEK